MLKEDLKFFYWSKTKHGSDFKGVIRTGPAEGLSE
jgi:hypothetical protein